jgi:tetratricopeptide (TPR) repeat protein
VDTWQGLGEVAPQDVAEAKRQVLRLQVDVPALVAPTDVTWRWDLDEGQRRAKIAPLVAEYDRAIKFAPEDDHGPLMQKALFLHTMYEYSEALAVYDELIEAQPSPWAHLQRSSVRLALGRRDDAIADMMAAYDQDPSNYTAFNLAKEMAYAGRIAEALEMLETLPVSEDERTSYADARALVRGLSGQTDEALAVLNEELADKPQDADALNADCWFRGLFNVALDSALTSCTRAVERAENPAPALDSRAMVKYRLGDHEAAIADLDQVLALAPGIAASRYLRGVVRIASGDNGGQEDIRTALRMEPQLAVLYARHGVKPAS